MVQNDVVGVEIVPVLSIDLNVRLQPPPETRPAKPAAAIHTTTTDTTISPYPRVGWGGVHSRFPLADAPGVLCVDNISVNEDGDGPRPTELGGWVGWGSSSTQRL